MPIKYTNRNNNGANTPTGPGAWTNSLNLSLNNYCVSYANGYFIAGGDGFIARSTSGTGSWDRTGWTSGIYYLAYGNGKWVAVSPGGSNTGVLYTSTNDGASWTDTYQAANNSRFAVAYGNNIWVIICESTSNNVILTSTDGTNWTGRGKPAGIPSYTTFRCLAFGGGTFVSVAYNGTNAGNTSTACITSTDGINWTTRTLPSSTYWYAVAYGNGIWVAIGGAGARSTDNGATWTSIPGISGYGITYGDGYFVIGGDSPKYSSDGVSWTSIASGPPTNGVTVGGWMTYGNGTFVSVVNRTTNNVVTAPMNYILSVAPLIKFKNINNNASGGRIGFIIPPGPVVYSPTQRAIFGYGEAGSYQSITNLVNNTGVLANDVAGVGTARAYLGAAGYGGDKAIFAYGVVAGTTNIKNLVSNTGVVANDSSGVGTSRNKLGAVSYGIDKAIFGYGSTVYGDPSASERVSMTNLVSNTGVVATDTTGVGSSRYNLAATGYGGDKAMFVYGQLNSSNNGLLTVNLVSNTGVVASDTSAAAGNGKTQGAGANYGGDKGIIGFGIAGGSYTRETNLVSNTGVIASNTANYYGYIGGVNDVLERGWLAAAGYGGDKAIFGFGALNASRYSYTNLVSNTGVVASNTYNSNPTTRYGLAAAGYSLT